MEADSSKLRDLAENAEFQQLVEETGEFIYLTVGFAFFAF